MDYIRILRVYYYNMPRCVCNNTIYCMVIYDFTLLFQSFHLNREQDSSTSRGGTWTSGGETGLASKSRVVILASLVLFCALMLQYTYQF